MKTTGPPEGPLRHVCGAGRARWPGSLADRRGATAAVWLVFSAQYKGPSSPGCAHLGELSPVCLARTVSAVTPAQHLAPSLRVPAAAPLPCRSAAPVPRHPVPLTRVNSSESRYHPGPSQLVTPAPICHRAPRQRGQTPPAGGPPLQNRPPPPPGRTARRLDFRAAPPSLACVAALPTRPALVMAKRR